MIKNRIKLLRQYMHDNQIDACIIPSSDPHQSEYVATHWLCREWISGFTGSSGLVIVTMEEAGLWTDSRYFIQAEKELKDTGIELHKVINRSHPSQLYWLRDILNKDETIAFNGHCISKSQYDQINKILSEKDIKIKLLEDLLSNIWHDRPALSISSVFEHHIKYAGLSRPEKINKVIDKIKESQADYLFVNKLDQIAWILNLRASDIKLNPVLISFLIIGTNVSYLFVDEGKLSQDIIEKLISDKIQIKGYESIGEFLSGIEAKSKIILNENTISIAHYKRLSCKIFSNKKSIIQDLKGKKNDVEIDNFRNCMIKDGVALTSAFIWLEEQIEKRAVSEFEFSEKIAQYRSAQALYHGESFDAIVGYNGNGAIVHYQPTFKESDNIVNEGVLLVDSGGQYQDGTTDITRTICLSPPSQEFKIAYSSVLKGMIGLSMTKFPKGTTGAQLDILARQHLWSYGMNYMHGTGHGVGFFLNVHEGPQGFSSGTTAQAQTPIMPGMVTSNEPGYYLENHYGIRIENLILCVESEYEGYYEFETLTYFPIETDAIVYPMMTKAEINWLNHYNSLVYEKISPKLDEKSRLWLEEKCKSI